MSFPASTLSGAAARVTLRIARPFTTLTSGAGCPATGAPLSIGATSVTPGADLIAAETNAILFASTTICVGSPSPPGKCLTSNRCPTTDSGLPVNVSTVPIPSAFRVVDVRAKPNRIIPVITQDLRGLRPIPLATFDHAPVIT